MATDKCKLCDATFQSVGVLVVPHLEQAADCHRLKLMFRSLLGRGRNVMSEKWKRNEKNFEEMNNELIKSYITTTCNFISADWASLRVFPSSTCPEFFLKHWPDNYRFMGAGLSKAKLRGANIPTSFWSYPFFQACSGFTLQKKVAKLCVLKYVSVLHFPPGF